MSVAQTVELYREALEGSELRFCGKDFAAQLRGHDLACWCPLDGPCHADVLLEVVNRRR